MTGSLAQSARVLLDPVDGVPTVTAARRWFWPLALLVVAACFSGVAIAQRLDFSSLVTGRLAAAGKLATLSDQDLADKITQARHLALVARVAQGLFGMPLMVLFLAVGLKLSAWLVGRPAPFRTLWSVVAVASLPIALYHVVLGICALWQIQIEPMAVQRLVPSSLAALAPTHHPKLVRVLGGLDFFGLWSAALLGLGYGAASGMPRRRALLFGLLLYVCFVAVFRVGLPGLRGGHP